MAFDGVVEFMKTRVPRYYTIPVELVRETMSHYIDRPLQEKMSERGYQWFLHDRGLEGDSDYDSAYEETVGDDSERDLFDGVAERLCEYFLPPTIVYEHDEAFYFEGRNKLADIIALNWDELYTELGGEDLST